MKDYCSNACCRALSAPFLHEAKVGHVCGKQKVGIQQHILDMASVIAFWAVVFFIVDVLQVQAGTIRVPQDHRTIQAAINAALDGDTIVVYPRKYVENLDFLGKSITVTSKTGPEKTVITGKGGDSVVKFASGEGSMSVLDGFTGQNGSGGPYALGDQQLGGGIAVYNSSPTIRRNIITGNVSSQGGGIGVYGGSPTIADNMITRNRAGQGAGIVVIDGSPIIEKKTITINWTGYCHEFSGGGGILISNESPEAAKILDNKISENSECSTYGGGGIGAWGNVRIQGNVISGNGGHWGGGILLGTGTWTNQNLIISNRAQDGGAVSSRPGESDFLLLSNTIADNWARVRGSALYLSGAGQFLNNIIVGEPNLPDLFPSIIFCEESAGTAQFNSNDVFSQSGSAYGGSCADQTGVSGNISLDPLFAIPEIGNYHLVAGSPVIDRGDSTVADLPIEDFEGDPRILDGDGDGKTAVDMGLDEFNPSVPVIVPFTSFDGTVLLFKGTAGNGRFLTRGSFTLGIESDGIDPVEEMVILYLADTDGAIFTQAIPPGSFRRSLDGSFHFSATSGGRGIRTMMLKPTKTTGHFTFLAEGSRLDLSGANNPPVKTLLQIGKDTGSKTVPCRSFSRRLVCP